VFVKQKKFFHLQQSSSLRRDCTTEKPPPPISPGEQKKRIRHLLGTPPPLYFSQQNSCCSCHLFTSPTRSLQKKPGRALHNKPKRKSKRHKTQTKSTRVVSTTRRFLSFTLLSVVISVCVELIAPRIESINRALFLQFLFLGLPGAVGLRCCTSFARLLHRVSLCPMFPHKK